MHRRVPVLGLLALVGLVDEALPRSFISAMTAAPICSRDALQLCVLYAATDRAKGLAIGLVLTALPMLGLIAAVRLFSSWWPLIESPGRTAMLRLTGNLGYISYHA